MTDIRDSKWLLPALLVFIVAIFYSPLSGFDFIVDEPILIVDRAAELADLTNVPDYFATDYWQIEGKHYFYYRPLITTINALSVAVSGLNARFFHVTNLIVHLLNLLLLFWILVRIFGNRFTVFWALLIYSVHPLAVPSVAWISGRTDLFAIFLMLLSLMMYMKYLDREKGGAALLVLSLLAYFMGCLSKETAVLLPLLALVYHLWMSGPKRRWTSLLAFLPISIAYILIRFSVQQSMESSFISMDFKFSGLLKVPGVVLYYFTKTFIPAAIQFIPNPNDILRTGPAGFIVLALLIAAAILVLRFFGRKYLFPLLWTAIFALPIIYILLVGYPGAGYYFYIPLVGLVFIFVDIAGRGVGWAVNRLTESEPIRSRALPVFFVLMLALVGYQGFNTMAAFSDEVTLWQDSLNMDGNNAQALKNLGRLSYEAGNYQQAVAFWERIGSESAVTGSNISDMIAAYGQLHRYEKADSLWQQANASELTSEKTSLNYAVTLIDRGLHDEALTLLAAISEKNPALPAPHRFMGMVQLYFKADTATAAEHFADYLSLKPNDPDTGFFRTIAESVE